MQVVIGGIGNVLCGDDGVGPCVVRLLEAQYDFGPEVSVADLGTPGLNLIVHLWDAEALILIDSVNDGKDPGSVSRYGRAEILEHSVSVHMDPHSPALTECLKIVESLGSALRHLVLIGVTGKDFAASVKTSDAVQRAVPQAIAEVLEQLDQLGVSYRKKAQPSAPAIWWQEPPVPPSSSKARKRGPQGAH